MSGRQFEAGYLSLLLSGELEKRAAEASAHLEDCDLCANACHKNRRLGEVGVCMTGEQARISSYGPHHGEEEPLSGWPAQAGQEKTSTLQTIPPAGNPSCIPRRKYVY